MQSSEIGAKPLVRLRDISRLGNQTAADTQFQSADPSLGYFSVRQLPDLANCFSHHRIAFLAIEGPGKFDHVGRRTVGAESWQRMGVGVSPQLRRLRPDVEGPNLGPSQEETLVRRKAAYIDNLRLVLQVLLVGRISDG